MSPTPKCSALFISTHALTEGDNSSINSFSKLLYFNSRPHRGRPARGIFDDRFSRISTHALTEGDFDLWFNRSIRLFQLTPSQRATLSNFSHYMSLSYFNSRPHRGRQNMPELYERLKKFQLTPSQRATIWKPHIS